MKAFLKKEKEKSIQRKHPWIFSGAIARIEGKLISGQTIEVYDSKGNFLAMGQFSEQSQIRIRILSFINENIDRNFLEKRVLDSISRRKINESNNNAARLIFSESDLLPGLIVDYYCGHFVVQYLSAGMEYLRGTLNEILRGHPLCRTLYERSDSGSRIKEGLKKRSGVLGTEEPPDFITVSEADYKYLVDIRNGHKTGYYLDQRINREKVGAYAAGKEAMNCFSYTGGFALSMLKRGAKSVLNVDSSREALETLKKNLEINQMDVSQVETLCADVFEVLRKFKQEGKKFDIIVLDPPKFAESAQQILKASRGYKDINRLAFELLRPGGILATFSCSGHISGNLFQKIVADAALDAKREAQIIEHLGQSQDHPVLLSFPEGEYLKGIVCRVMY